MLAHDCARRGGTRSRSMMTSAVSASRPVLCYQSRHRLIGNVRPRCSRGNKV